MNIQELLKAAMLEPFPYFKKVGVWSFYTDSEKLFMSDSLFVFFEEYAQIIKFFIGEFNSSSVELKIIKPDSGRDYSFEGLFLTSNGMPLNDYKINQIVQYLNSPLTIETINSSRGLIVSTSVSGLIRIKSNVLEKPNLIEVELIIDKLNSNSTFQFEIKVSVNNFAFLPNNPLLEEKHYDLWAQNAPYLARGIQKIQQSSLFRLDIEDRNEKDYGYPYGQNPLFLQNSFKTHFDKDWDETYVPLDLVKMSHE